MAKTQPSLMFEISLKASEICSTQVGSGFTSKHRLGWNSRLLAVTKVKIIASKPGINVIKLYTAVIHKCLQ
jgi:hypothetical protein